MNELIDAGDGLTVELVTAWVPLSWLVWDEYPESFPADVRQAVDPHRGHYVATLDSAFGWRAIHCTTCGQELWTHTRSAT